MDDPLDNLQEDATPRRLTPVFVTLTPDNFATVGLLGLTAYLAAAFAVQVAMRIMGKKPAAPSPPTPVVAT